MLAHTKSTRFKEENRGNPSLCSRCFVDREEDSHGAIAETKQQIGCGRRLSHKDGLQGTEKQEVHRQWLQFNKGN